MGYGGLSQPLLPVAHTGPPGGQSASLCLLAPSSPAHQPLLAVSTLAVSPSTLSVGGNQARPFPERIRGGLKSLSTWAGCSLPPSAAATLRGVQPTLIPDVPGQMELCSQWPSACSVPTIGFLLCRLFFSGIAPTSTPKLPVPTSLCYEDVRVLDIKKPFGLANCPFLLISK